MSAVIGAIRKTKKFFSKRAVRIFLLRTSVCLVAIFGLWTFYTWANTVNDQTNEKRKVTQVDAAQTTQASLDQYKLALINLFYLDGSQPDSDISMAKVWSSVDSTRADLEKAINSHSSNDQLIVAEKQKVMNIIVQEKKLFATYKNEYKSVDKIMQYVVGIDVDVNDVSKANENVTKISAATNGLDKYQRSDLLSAETKDSISKITACLSVIKQNLGESKQQEATSALASCEKQYRTLRKNTLIDINNTPNSKSINQLITQLSEVNLR